MSWTIPNGTDVPTSAAYGLGALAVPYSADFAVVETALEGTRIVSGCQLVPGSTTGTVKLNGGTAIFAGLLVTIAAQDNVACVSNADANHPLWIVYEIDTGGTLRANVGVADVGNTPVPPIPTTGRIVPGFVLLTPSTINTGGAVDAATSTANNNAKIVDKRVMPSPSVSYVLLQPVYTTVADGVTQNTSTTVAAGSNGVNLNTLVGTQTLAVTSSVGLPLAGAIILTHGGTGHLVTYNGISGNTLQNVTADGSSTVIATGDAVSNSTIVTSATANFSGSNVGSYITGSADLPQAQLTTTIGAAGTVPGGTSTFAVLNAAVSGAHTAQTFTFAAVGGTLVEPVGVTIVDVYSIAGGGGGASGTNVANNTTDANGGGAGGPGGASHFAIAAADLWQSGPVAWSVGQGGRGGAGSTGAAVNGTAGAGNGLSGSFTNLIGLAGGGQPGVATTGGNNGWGTSTVVGSFKGGNGAIGSSSTAATAGYDAKANGGYTPGGGGGGGGLHGSGSVTIAAAGGGGGGSFGFLFGGANGGGAGSPGSNGGSYSGTYTNSIVPGGGGGGGNPRNTTGNGQAGGNGGKFGGGGGGGGNSVAGTSGAGGIGGDGATLLILRAA